MTTSNTTADNPFVDPMASIDEQVRDASFALDSTLAVGRDATLTLATDSLIVLGELRAEMDVIGTANLHHR
jgi:sphingosine kinase